MAFYAQLPAAGAEQSQSRASEQPLLELLSFRVVGFPLPDLYPGGVIPAGQSETTGRDYSVSRLLEHGSNFDQYAYGNVDNRSYASVFPPDPLGPRGTLTPWGFTTWGGGSAESNWKIEGEIGFTTGAATFAGNEGQRFSLAETLTTSSGNEFEFYQRYVLDHSYINGREFVVGAGQRLEQVLWDGDLRLEEEYSKYTDLGNAGNDRQRGEFRLRFDPQFDKGRWNAGLDYRYIVKVYEIFSTRSYIYHSGRVKLDHELSDTVHAAGRIRLDDYNYSIGGDRGNNRLSYGGSWNWQATDELELSLSADRQQKNYDVRKDRTYERLDYEAAADWRPDERSRIELKAELSDYSRPFDQPEDYEDASLELRLQRYIGEKLEVSAWFRDRHKEYSADPLRDLDVRQMRLSANITPSRQTSLAFDFGTADYDYANLLRTFNALNYSVSAGYAKDGLRASAGYTHRENSYSASQVRDHRQDFVDAALDYRFDRQRIRVYYAVGELTQPDPLAVNGFTESRLGGEWDFALDSATDLRLVYEVNKRDYDSWGAIRDERFEAVLSFEL